jgi:hypothetical protein
LRAALGDDDSITKRERKERKAQQITQLPSQEEDCPFGPTYILERLDILKVFIDPPTVPIFLNSFVVFIFSNIISIFLFR